MKKSKEIIRQKSKKSKEISLKPAVDAIWAISHHS